MIRVVIADDQQMIRVGLRGILESADDIEVVGDAEDGQQAALLVDRGDVDVVLMDLRMPILDGVRATLRIREDHPADAVRILVLTTFEQDENVLAALRAGANGFLGKAVSPGDLLVAIRDVVAGGGALSPAAQSALIGHVADERPPSIDEELATRFATLTARERQATVAACQGLDNERIGRDLFVSPFTVKTHINRAMAKVGARDRAQLVAFAYRAGLAGASDSRSGNP